jgi:glycosyltransferase involved in cell wall biosynthesis
VKLGFIFDTNILEYNGHYYSVNLTPQLWESRYLSVFDSIAVITRSHHSESEPEGKLTQSDIEGVEFRTLPNKSPLQRIINQKQEEFFLEQAISDCDFIIIRSWWGFKACRKSDKKFLFEVITDAWDVMWNHSLIGKIVAVPYFIKQRKAIYNSPYVVYVTEKTLQKRYPTKGRNLGISDVYLNEDFNNETLEKRIRKIHDKSDSLVLGTAGAVNVNYKGQRFIIEAIALLKKCGIENVEYEIAGSGDPTNLIELSKKLGVENHIHLVGSIPHDKIFKWFDSIDVYVQPSLQEGLPRAVVEAMSRALPCLGTSTGGIPELIPREYICKNHGNISGAFASLIKRLDNSELEKMANRNFEFSKKYDSKLINTKRISFLLEAVSDN